MKVDERLLTQALANNNERFMGKLTVEIGEHEFSKRFEKKMTHLVKAEKNYGGRVWLEKCVNYCFKVAAVILCFIVINIVSINAFDLDIWNIITTKTDWFTNISFEKQVDVESTNMFEKLKITKIPEGYELVLASEDDMFIQSFASNKGTITYTESDITETVNIRMESEESNIEKVADREINFVEQEGSIAAFFVDEKYYHVLEIQGEDANREYAKKIIEELEER